MPDPRLSADIADRLIEPATRAAVQSNFARLNGVTTVPPGQTIDGMMRDMLRPMLKAWLDEHLPVRRRADGRKRDRPHLPRRRVTVRPSPPNPAC